MSLPHPPPRPTGCSPAAIFMQRVWDVLWDPKTNLFCQSNGVKADKTPSGYLLDFKSARARGSVAGWHFNDTAIVVDPTMEYDAQSVIYVPHNHALCTTGIRDLANPGAGLKKVNAGTWVSTQYVPAKTTSGGHDVWNLPQYPLPSVAEDNPDDKTMVFWLWVSEAPFCYA